MAWAHQGVDVSWPQNSYMPGGQGFVIVGGFTNDGGGFNTHSTYHKQVDNAIAQGVDHGIYIFNGPDDPVAFANYCADNLYRFGPNDSVWLDVETNSDGRPAYTPARALAFIKQFNARTGVIPGVYLNQSEMNGFDWSALVSYGVLLWLAYYHPTLPALKWWSEAAMQQFTDLPLDEDYSLFTQAEIRAKENGAAVVTPPKWKEADMLYIYSVNRGGGVVGPTGFYPLDPTSEEAQVALATYGTPNVPNGTLSDREWDVARQTAINIGAQLVADVAKQITAGTVDAKAIADAVVAALPASPEGATVDTGALAQAVETAIAAQLAALPAAVVQAEGSALSKGA